jgi:hypothetical protein
MRSGSGGSENVTICEPSALVVAVVSGTGYNMGIGGRELPPPPPAMTTATFPAYFALETVNGQCRYEFQPCGGHQAYCRRYVKNDDGNWQLLSSGCNWIGIMRQRYSDLKAKGLRSADNTSHDHHS